jgi:hypothetical protein
LGWATRKLREEIVKAAAGISVRVRILRKDSVEADIIASEETEENYEARKKQIRGEAYKVNLISFALCMWHVMYLRFSLQASSSLGGNFLD